MRTVLFSCVVLCMLLAVDGQTQTGWCLYSTTDTFSVYNVTAMSLTAPRSSDPYAYTMSSCGTTTCGGYSNCKICQTGTNGYSLCTGSISGGVSSELPSNYTGSTGYQVVFEGATEGCPLAKPRRSFVYVLCGQTENKLVHLGENVVCEYHFELYLTTSCSFVAPPPTLQKVGQTSASIDLQITLPSALSNTPFLQKSYNVTMNGALGYKGIFDLIEVGTPKGSSFTFQVSGQYGKYVSDWSEPLTIAALPFNSTSEEIILNTLAYLQQAIQALAVSNQQTQAEISKVEQQITVDVLPVVQHGDDVVTDSRLFLTNMNTGLSSNVNAVNNKLDAQVIPSLVKLQSSVDAVNGKSPSGGSSNVGWVFFSLFLGIAIGAVGALAVVKYVLKIDISLPNSKSKGYSSAPLLSEEEPTI